MFVSPKAKLILLTNPKTGTTSFRSMLEENFDCIAYGHDVSLLPIPKKYAGYKVIMIHRHPYERFLSRWFSVKEGIEAFHEMTPDRFFDLSIANATGLDMTHIIPQVSYMRNNTIDYLIAFDKFDEGLRAVPNLSHIDFTKYKINVSNGGQKTDMLSEDLIKRLNAYYDEDFKIFGYKRQTKIKNANETNGE